MAGRVTPRPTVLQERPEHANATSRRYSTFRHARGTDSRSTTDLCGVRPMSRAVESTPDPADDDSTPSADATYVGVSTGTDTLLAAASAQPTLGTEFSVDAAHVRERAAYLATTIGALQFTPFDSSAGEAQLFAAVWHQIRPQLDGGAAELIDHVQRFDTPRIVLAERRTSTTTLWERRQSDDGTGAWLPTAARQAVTDRAREAGIPVVRVAAGGRRDDCHQCGATGSVVGGELSCPDRSCPVDRVARAQNAAVHLARRGSTN